MPALSDKSDKIELACTLSSLDVREDEYARLLGFPQGWVFEGRAHELACWARDWYAQHGRPWMYAREAEQFELADGSISVDGVRFSSQRLRNTLKDAEAHSVILVAVGAGSEAEEEARRRWTDDKPDEYFFLEVYASAVVEHLTTLAGARLCDWAEQRQMAVLPHYSPGYPEWDIQEQSRFLDLLKRTRSQRFPSSVEVFDSGMLRPKKTQLAAFGVTRHTDRLQKLTTLVPCERCSFGPCQYRRAPYRRAPRATGEQIQMRTPAIDRNANYQTNKKALERWAEERLTLREEPDGCVDAVFRYDGTTCTNMGRPLTFLYRVKLGPRAEGYPIREQECLPAAGDDGYTYMCRFVEDANALMAAIEREKPLKGERLDAVLEWKRIAAGAGCYCEVSSRDHKWGIALETIHYALVQRELTEEAEER
ncbi:MAG: hypothetical protein WAL45_19415 [Terracidiphilus sp.]